MQPAEAGGFGVQGQPVLRSESQSKQKGKKEEEEKEEEEWKGEREEEVSLDGRNKGSSGKLWRLDRCRKGI